MYVVFNDVSKTLAYRSWNAFLKHFSQTLSNCLKILLTSFRQPNLREQPVQKQHCHNRLCNVIKCNFHLMFPLTYTKKSQRTFKNNVFHTLMRIFAKCSQNTFLLAGWSKIIMHQGRHSLSNSFSDNVKHIKRKDRTSHKYHIHK